MKDVVLMSTSGGSGKDTIADLIINKLAHGGRKVSLGGTIHEMCNQLSPAGVERHHLQDFGESVRKIFGENTWIGLVDRTIKSNVDMPCWVVPDVRKLLEFSHYCCERNFAPLYIKVDRETAKQRLISRDGGFNQADLNRSIESQMNFIEKLPTDKVGASGLCRVKDSGIFNQVYIIDNSGKIAETERQLKEWWNVINGK